ncbi:MAG: MFS transporter [Terriglobia bacterium]|jgi:MFS family permease|nr:MFS transporter [Terriglobia bacterium]
MNYRRAGWALFVLTGLNFVNYIDRSVLFAVQPLIQSEFHRSDAEFGFLTSAFIICYMCTAPFIGPLADRFQRRRIMVIGALIWSAATLLTAVTFSFETLFIRHLIVGIGEATFVTIAPAFLSDIFPEHKRGRIMAIFSAALPMGYAIGYMVGGKLGEAYGWRHAFLIASIPGFILALMLLFVQEPTRGAEDHLKETVERGTILGLRKNAAFWSCTLGMAMMTFATSGMSVWMPTFLVRVRSVPLARANFIFGAVTLVSGFLATVIGGWLGDYLLRYTKGAYYLVSAIGMALAVPAIYMAVTYTGSAMYPSIFLAEFMLLVNTAPLNAAMVNSVSARIRATASAVNIFFLHALGDALSPTVMGRISDESHGNLRLSFLAVTVAVALSAIILFWGIRKAPDLKVPDEAPGAVQV